MEKLNFSCDINILLKIRIEKKIEEYKKMLLEQNKVPKITWEIWAELLDDINDSDDNYNTLLQLLYKIKYENENLTIDDENLLEDFFRIIERSDKVSTKISNISRTLQIEALNEENNKKKPMSIIMALNNTYRNICDDEDIFDGIWKGYAKKQRNSTLNITVEMIDEVADLVIARLLNSFEFIKQYLGLWRYNDLDVIAKTANQVLHKYKDNDNYNIILDIIQNSSCSYVYSKEHKQFKFLDDKAIGHTDSVLEFVTDSFGYSDFEDIPYARYPECDVWIENNIEIKGENNRRYSLGLFSNRKKESKTNV